jgi:transcriptional regulator
MYNPHPFTQNDEPRLVEFVRSHPFGMLVMQAAAFPQAAHIPFELQACPEGGWELLGHIASANPLAAHIGETMIPVLVVFIGEHAYVSSSWYGHENVSTWNYRAVHARGRLERLSVQNLQEHLFRLQDHHEGDRPNAAHARNMSPDKIRSYLTEVIGFRIRIESLEGAWKLSQNRNQADFKSVVSGLEATENPGALQLAGVMREVRPDAME